MKYSLISIKRIEHLRVSNYQLNTTRIIQMGTMCIVILLYVCMYVAYLVHELQIILTWRFP